MKLLKLIPQCKAALVCLAILAIVEFGVVRSDWFWKRIPNSVAGVIDAVEDEVISQHRGQPIEVLLLGNSRLLDAVPPRELEQQLGLSEESILNLSMTGGTPFDLRRLYEANRESLKQAKVVVIDFELTYLNGGVALNDRVQRTASLTDRVDLFAGKRELLPALIGWVWRAYGVRGSFAGGLWQLARPTNQPSPIADDGRINWPPNEDVGVRHDDQSYIEQRAMALAFSPPEFSVWKQQQSALIRMLKEDGAIIVLTHVPLRTAIVDHARRRYALNYEQLVDEWKQHAKKCDSMLFIDRGEAIGVTDGEFYDYGHLRSTGASAFTMKLSEHLRSNGLVRTAMAEHLER